MIALNLIIPRIKKRTTKLLCFLRDFGPIFYIMVPYKILCRQSMYNSIITNNKNFGKI